MAGTPGQLPTLAERTDIHKSCKSFEVLLNLLNDYCGAVSAAVQLQKKLAKAIRETAALKTTDEIPCTFNLLSLVPKGLCCHRFAYCGTSFMTMRTANVLSGCAMIFEALSDVDVKYSKFADREYDAVSTEIKKWFKKLSVSLCISRVVRHLIIDIDGSPRKRRKLMTRG